MIFCDFCTIYYHYHYLHGYNALIIIIIIFNVIITIFITIFLFFFFFFSPFSPLSGVWRFLIESPPGIACWALVTSSGALTKTTHRHWISRLCFGQLDALPEALCWVRSRASKGLFLLEVFAFFQHPLLVSLSLHACAKDKYKDPPPIVLEASKLRLAIVTTIITIIIIIILIFFLPITPPPWLRLILRSVDHLPVVWSTWFSRLGSIHTVAPNSNVVEL